MTNFARKAAFAATAAMLAAAPAMAAPNSDTDSLTAKAVIVKPITLVNDADLDFGTITLGNTLVSSTVVVTQAGGVTCGSNLTCLGGSAGHFILTGGVGGQTLDVSNAAPGTLNSLTDSIGFAIDAPLTVTLASDGTGEFSVGGTVTVANTTDDGYYEAVFDVTATYQ